LPSQDAARVLVVDDNPDDRDLVSREILRAFPSYVIAQVPDPATFDQELSAENFDLVITDYQLLWSTGIKVLERIKGRCPDCPVIMFTGSGNEEIAVEAMKRGLDDYLIKTPAHYSRLPAAIRAAFESRAKRRAEEELRRALAEKDLLLNELYHRVKNNMQIVTSLLDLQAAAVNDPKTLDMLRVVQGRIRAMALVHEKLYEAKDLTRISFGSYAYDLACDLFASYGVDPTRIRLKLDINIDGDVIPVDQAVPCGLIINELLSNSIKHAFPDERTGEVRIELRGEDRSYSLVVADNGVGIPRSFDMSSARSLGVRLVHSLAEQQLNGTIETIADGKTEVRITFPRCERLRGPHEQNSDC
jgi:two-component sensor histidine kinase